MLQCLEPAGVLLLGQGAPEVLALSLERDAFGLQIAERLTDLAAMRGAGGIARAGEPYGNADFTPHPTVWELS